MAAWPEKLSVLHIRRQTSVHRCHRLSGTTHHPLLSSSALRQRCLNPPATILQCPAKPAAGIQSEGTDQK
ncbi:hypothetical protein DL89DRAFT_270051 [Linderina pennispora]|uniref:Uncharacterized protein n=1 Tax=Linderina pennispora TaxID=61395 RepID=A0A1Y1VZ35_9FUNG|nr:uncharacterized protein DL89DRAFT_270051 [Linderina pennispora]ORX66528.1 hypothetical protein DL89DRAFT_270051 [Linderina pennispora]